MATIETKIITTTIVTEKINLINTAEEISLENRLVLLVFYLALVVLFQEIILINHDKELFILL